MYYTEQAVTLNPRTMRIHPLRMAWHLAAASEYRIMVIKKPYSHQVKCNTVLQPKIGPLVLDLHAHLHPLCESLVAQLSPRIKGSYALNLDPVKTV